MIDYGELMTPSEQSDLMEKALRAIQDHPELAYIIAHTTITLIEVQRSVTEPPR